MIKRKGVEILPGRATTGPRWRYRSGLLKSSANGGSGLRGGLVQGLEFERKIKNPKFLHPLKIFFDSFFSWLLIIGNLGGGFPILFFLCNFNFKVLLLLCGEIFDWSSISQSDHCCGGCLFHSQLSSLLASTVEWRFCFATDRGCGAGRGRLREEGKFSQNTMPRTSSELGPDPLVRIGSIHNRWALDLGEQCLFN